ncbi:hypothetical protein K474DRAFT_1333101 [Panus rudis PR-1116 ss-1]|nr:hypothetical protein K474DRAFT_1333101 [Panus rudis PR-1116 ss-1]
MAMRLNTDELLIALSFLGQADIINVMCTCHALHKLGLPVLLGSPIKLDKKKTFKTFAAFISKEVQRYGPLLRDITISGIARDPRTPGSRARFDLDTPLAAIIQHSTNLHTLEMNSILAMHHYPKFMHSLVMLPSTLRKLTLHFSNWCYPLLADSLKESSWSLTHLSIHYYRPNYDEVVDILITLSRFSATLESLVLTDIPISKRLDRAGGTLVFPRLKSLDIVNLLFHHHVPAPELVSLFPHLRRLSILAPHYSPSVSRDFLINSANAEEFRVLNDRVTRKDNLWTHLDYLSSSLATLYGLGLKSPVAVLDLGSSLSQGSLEGDPQITQLQSLILECRPQALRVIISFPLAPEHFQVFRNMLRESPQLSHISYRLSPAFSANLNVTRVSMTEAEITEIRGMTDMLIAMHEGLSSLSCIHITWSFPLAMMGNILMSKSRGPDFVERLINACPALCYYCVEWDNDKSFFESISTPEGRMAKPSEPEAWGQHDVFARHRRVVH